MTTEPDPTAAAADTPEHDAVDPELEMDLRRLGLQGDLCALVLKREATEIIGFGSAVTILPMAYLVTALSRGIFGEEALGLGLRQTLRVLRPQGQSLLLGETLLSLARAARMMESHETRLLWILEGIQTFRALNAERRLGRGYIDLAVTLKDGRDYYDALHALGEAEQACGRAGDSGGVAAARYHRGHIYRMVGQPIEALRELQRALPMLPEGRSADSWRQQVRSERVFNLLTLKRFDDALVDLNAWITSGDDHSFPMFCRGEVFERRGERESALADYGEGAIRLAREILASRSDRFRRIKSLKNRHLFENAVRAALHFDSAPIALSLLELWNTGARALQPPESANGSPDEKALAQIAAEAAALREDAEAALSKDTEEALDNCQERGDLLLAERDVIGAASPKVEDAPSESIERADLEGIRQRIHKLLPHDAVLLEYTIVGSEVWLVAATHDRTVLHKSALDGFELQMLKQSVIFECDGLLRPVALEVLEKALLAPVEQLLPGKRLVVITLADAAYGIPFHAMRWEAGVLIDTHDVQYVVGGVTVTTGIRSTEAAPVEGFHCRFLGTPSVKYAEVEELSGVETECAVLRDLVPATQLRVSLPATSAELFDGLSTTVLHVACHGTHEERAPLMSRLLFADRPVFAFEIALGRFACNIAIIAGCQTASAVSASGGYVQSIASAFQRGGVGTVVASLWNVDDDSSAALMRTFYEVLLADRTLSAVSALCAAQRSLRAQPGFEALSYWAPFVVFEDLRA